MLRLCCRMQKRYYIQGFSAPSKPGIMWRCQSSQHQVEQPSNRGKEGCRSGSFLTSWDLQSGEIRFGSVSVKFVLVLSISYPFRIHFVSISYPFHIHFYVFLSTWFQSILMSIHLYSFLIPIHSLFFLAIQSKQVTMIHCSQTSRSAKTKQHLEASRCILKCKLIYYGLFEVGQNEMEACFLERPCQPAMAICQTETTMLSLSLKNSLRLHDFVILYPVGQPLTQYFVHHCSPPEL